MHYFYVDGRPPRAWWRKYRQYQFVAYTVASGVHIVIYVIRDQVEPWDDCFEDRSFVSRDSDDDDASMNERINLTKRELIYRMADRLAVYEEGP